MKDPPAEEDVCSVLMIVCIVEGVRDITIVDGAAKTIRRMKDPTIQSSSSLFLLSAMKDPPTEEDVCSVLMTVCIVEGVRDITLEGCMLIVGVAAQQRQSV